MAGGRYRHGVARPAPLPPAPPPYPCPPPPPHQPAPLRPPVFDGREPYAPPGWEPRPKAESLLVLFGSIGLACLAAVVLLGGALWVFAHSGAPIRDTPRWGQFEDPAVIAAAQRGCARLEQGLAAIPAPAIGAPPARQRAAMDAENAAVERVVRQMRALGSQRLADDPPALDWVGDWEALVAARERYATDLVAGRPATFDMPVTAEGWQVVDRIDHAVPGCIVPERLYELPLG